MDQGLPFLPPHWFGVTSGIELPSALTVPFLHRSFYIRCHATALQSVCQLNLHLACIEISKMFLSLPLASSMQAPKQKEARRLTDPPGAQILTVYPIAKNAGDANQLSKKALRAKDLSRLRHRGARHLTISVPAEKQ